MNCFASSGCSLLLSNFFVCLSQTHVSEGRPLAIVGGHAIIGYRHNLLWQGQGVFFHNLCFRSLFLPYFEREMPKRRHF